MTTSDSLRELSARGMQGPPVVSCYLDVDSAHWTQYEIAERVQRLVRQARIDVTRREYRADELWAISMALDLIVRHVGARPLTTDTRGLALFGFARSGLLRAISLAQPVDDCLIIAHAPYLKPLVALLDADRPDSDERLLLTGLNAAVRESYGVSGVSATLRALHAGQVEMLIVDCRLTRPGSTCLRCGRLFNSLSACPECGSNERQIEDDLFDAAIRTALGAGAEVSTVTRESVWPGMGAILKRSSAPVVVESSHHRDSSLRSRLTAQS